VSSAPPVGSARLDDLLDAARKAEIEKHDAERREEEHRLFDLATKQVKQEQDAGESRETG
jgi:hypothetical protein